LARGAPQADCQKSVDILAALYCDWITARDADWKRKAGGNMGVSEMLFLLEVFFICIGTAKIIYWMAINRKES
jgi:hypothetical protein